MAVVHWQIWERERIRECSLNSEDKMVNSTLKNYGIKEQKNHEGEK